MSMKKTTFGLIVGNRGFFPGHLCLEGRNRMIELLQGEGFDVVSLCPDDTPFGSVETFKHARMCADLFKKKRERIDGIIITLPNFGDEKAVADTLKMADLHVPVLVHAFPDDPSRMSVQERRDSFCGKISVCNNLSQHGIPFSLTARHTIDPESEGFREDLQRFAACCRVYRGLKGARIGAVGARPAAFNTVRFSEKLLEANGITVETIDLYEVFGRIEKLSDNDGKVKTKLDELKRYGEAKDIPDGSLMKMAKFGVFMDGWARENELSATAVQCWTAMEEYFGIVPCTIMSMLSESLLPSACEVDVTGALGMLALELASGKPSALLDWNNNFGDDPDGCVLFHCSNLPKSFFKEMKMDYHEIIAGAVGKEKSYGTCVGQLKAGPFCFVRISTDDRGGSIRAYAGEGQIIDSPFETFGGYGVARIPGMQELLRYICTNGFEHHVAVNRSRFSRAVYEALKIYLGWDVYLHKNEG